MTIPPLEPEQLEAARAAAAAARRRRAEVKQQLRDREISFSGVLELAAQDPVVAHMRVTDVLRAVPRVGEKRAAELMARHEVADTRRLRGLGHKQAQGLTEELG